MNRGKDDAAFWPPLGKGMSLVGVSMDEEMLPKIDYYIDQSDPDVVILRRQDGTFVAAFSARGPRGRVSSRPPRKTTGS